MAEKYEECRNCGKSTKDVCVNSITGLCNTCTSNEEYNEHERRTSGC